MKDIDNHQQEASKIVTDLISQGELQDDPDLRFILMFESAYDG